jgi:general L-amino acid transport system permease protein
MKGRWARDHLFQNWWNTLLTLVLGGLVVWAGLRLVLALLQADFEILRVNLALFMVGQFPRAELWRPAVAAVAVLFAVGTAAGAGSASAGARAVEAGLSHRPATAREIGRRFWPVLVVVAVVLAFTRTLGPALVALAAIAAGLGGYLVLRRTPQSWVRYLWGLAALVLAGAYLVLVGSGVGWNDWGGLHLNLFLTVAGLLLAFPVGIVMALGRRTTMPVLRWLSVTYIEAVRGVPLVTLLLMGAFALGFLLPANLRPGAITRILVAIVAFESAYMAEVVRGGLQAVPHGQVEAAQALGLSPWKVTRLVVIPQALRATIPAMVGQFISLFKDTSLVVIVGLTDVLRASNLANAQGEFLAKGLHAVTLPFVGMIFWVGSYTMSREARRLERRLGVGER